MMIMETVQQAIDALSAFDPNTKLGISMSTINGYVMKITGLCLTEDNIVCFDQSDCSFHDHEVTMTPI